MYFFSMLFSPWFLCVFYTTCLKWTHIGLVMFLCLSVCIFQLESHAMYFDKLDLNIMPL
jgi:hypothetical protein